MDNSLLKSYDWDFVDTSSSNGVHSIHSYPAKFIPQIPRQLIKLFANDKSRVILDPFCGSGTTLVEAILKGFDAWGIDINPVSCLISRVKTRRLPNNFLFVLRQVLEEAKEHYANNTVILPEIPRLDHWFKKDIQKAVKALLDKINLQESILIKEGLQVALSKILVQVSNQESDTRYAAVEKNVTYLDVFVKFEKAAVIVFNELSKISDDLFKKLGKAVVINKDIMKTKGKDLPDNIGLIITSPPYPNAYEYWLYHKYRMYWLGMDPIKVRENEIGARPHYFKKNHQDERDFENQMSKCFELLSRVMIKNGKACFLVGDSVIHGKTIDNSLILHRAAEPYGFKVIDEVERNILVTRKTFNPKHGRLKKETILVFSLNEKI